MSEETGPVVDNTEPVLNLDAPVGEQQTQAPNGDAINPAWNEVLGIIPKEFHPQITPHFKSWDQNVQQLTEKTKQEAIKPYAPYQRFVDNRVAPDELVAAYQIFRNLNEQPLELYTRLGEMLKQQGLLQPETTTPTEDDPEEQQFKDPRVDALQKQQLEFMQQFQAQQIQTQQQQAIQQFAQQVNQQVDQEFAQLGQAIGGQVPDFLRLELIRRATLLSEQEQRSVSILEAYQDWQQLQAQTQRIRNAPKVVPSGGGFPQQTPNAEALKSPDGRAAAVKDIIDRMNNQQ